MLEDIKGKFAEDLDAVRTLPELSNLKVQYLGKRGVITSSLKSLSSLPLSERPLAGKIINDIKVFIESRIADKESILREAELKNQLLSEYIDITLPGRYALPGSEHPLSKVLSEVVDIFVKMGFSVEEGPEVELDFYNFEALNIPKEHPARDMQDTFYISEDIVLRTHTSPVQIRGMKRRNPPVRFIVPGKVYRCDADISHTPMFHQVEGVMIDRQVTFSNLKGILIAFIHLMFGHETPVRFRPSFFPFTEPSAEVDMGCILCKGAGCRVCKGSGWLEILGAGMVHPVVLENVGYNTEIYNGFAFGMGVERIAMLKYRIDDIRLFFENDVRFLRQF